MNCGEGLRCSSDLAWQWLWRRLAAAAPVQSLAWEPPCAEGTVLEKAKKIKKKKEESRKIGKGCQNHIIIITSSLKYYANVWIFAMLVVFLRFLKFVIRRDLFSHSKGNLTCI